jgi:4-aminobutyrate aminotransferase-like enzyme
MVAFTLESPAQRDEYIRQMHTRQLLVLASGEQAIRFRMPLVVTEAEIDQALERIADCNPAGV